MPCDERSGIRATLRPFKCVTRNEKRSAINRSVSTDWSKRSGGSTLDSDNLTGRLVEFSFFFLRFVSLSYAAVQKYVFLSSLFVFTCEKYTNVLHVSKNSYTYQRFIEFIESRT